MEVRWCGWLTPDDIFFNRVAFTNINFFDFSCGAAVKVIRENVAAWYYTLRIFAIAALLVVLIYIGIRMAISTVASDQARYKKMITDWVVSFALVFLLHYIVIVALNVNNGLVEILKKIMENMSNYSAANTNFEKLASELVKKSFLGSASVTWAATICYGILVGMTAAFLFSYIKRMLTIGFLIMIAPIITITYSIDRVGDGKAQALNTWLREFLLNVMIQPFHCLIYLIYASAAINLINSSGWSSVSGMILAIMCMAFIWPAEKIVKTIFGFKNSSTMPNTAASLVAITQLQQTAQKVASSVGGASKKISRNLNVNNNTTLNNLGQKLSNVPVLKQAGEAVDRARSSDSFAKRRLGDVAKIADTIAKPHLDISSGIAIGAMKLGASGDVQNPLDNAVIAGVGTYNAVNTITKSLKEGGGYREDVQDSENEFKAMLDQYAQQNGLDDYKNNDQQFDRLKQEIERLINTDLGTLESRVQMMLQNFVTNEEWTDASGTRHTGFDLNNQDHVAELATRMDRLATVPLNDPSLSPQERNLAQAMQDRTMAARGKNLAQKYSAYGVSDTRAAVNEVLDRIREETYDAGPRGMPNPNPTGPNP